MKEEGSDKWGNWERREVMHWLMPDAHACVAATAANATFAWLSAVLLFNVTGLAAEMTRRTRAPSGRV